MGHTEITHTIGVGGRGPRKTGYECRQCEGTDLLPTRGWNESNRGWGEILLRQSHTGAGETRSIYVRGEGGARRRKKKNTGAPEGGRQDKKKKRGSF